MGSKGSSADVAIGINTTDPVEGGPALVTLVSTAIRAFKSSVVVSGASRPIIAAGSVDALAGNIIIGETLHGQFQPGQEICVTILPRASDGVLTQDTFVKTATTNDLPITTTNAATGLLVSTVSTSGLPPKLESSSVLLPTLSTGFRFKVAQRSSGSSLGQITISNIHLITVVGALKGPVLIDVMGDAQGGAIAFQTIVSNALIG